MLAFNFGLRFFVVFLGCLRAGIIAVPVYPPSPATLKKSLRKLQLVVDGCEPKMILVGPLVNKLRLASKLKAIAMGGSDWPDARYHCPDVKDETSATFSFSGWLGAGSSLGATKMRSFDEATIKPQDVAFLQFTSGSTSDPKGVMLTYANLEHNISCVIRSVESVRSSLPAISRAPLLNLTALFTPPLLNIREASRTRDLAFSLASLFVRWALGNRQQRWASRRTCLVLLAADISRHGTHPGYSGIVCGGLDSGILLPDQLHSESSHLAAAHVQGKVTDDRSTRLCLEALRSEVVRGGSRNVAVAASLGQHRPT